MREVEATFRDASEMTNTRAVYWSLVQIGVLVGAAIWQMRYLKVSSILSPSESRPAGRPRLLVVRDVTGNRHIS